MIRLNLLRQGLGRVNRELLFCSNSRNFRGLSEIIFFKVQFKDPGTGSWDRYEGGF